MEVDQTLQALITAWRREPQAVFVRLADAYLQAGTPDKAASVLRDGLSRWPHNLAARVALARVLFEQGELDDAESELDNVLDREPDHWGALDLLATLKRQQGDRLGEVAALQTLLQLAPGRRQVERRLQIARRDLEERAAVPAPPPSDAPPLSDRVPTMRHPSVTDRVLASNVKRVKTVPSAKVPVRLTREKRTEPGSPFPGVPRSSQPPPAEDPFFNETMVDLLVAQGRIHEARELTERLATKRPGRPNIQQRLAGLSSETPTGEIKATSKELEELMQGVLSSAAAELEMLTGPIPQPPVGGEG
ncbi:MAG: tetratricopeptide repeat protein [Deltaproteobacteria bacterium]|nr:tetratricopeptide repeat protein [Deltaproteobacteria bacterium]